MCVGVVTLLYCSFSSSLSVSITSSSTPCPPTSSSTSSCSSSSSISSFSSSSSISSCSSASFPSSLSVNVSYNITVTLESIHNIATPPYLYLFLYQEYTRHHQMSPQRMSYPIMNGISNNNNNVNNEWSLIIVTTFSIMNGNF